MDVDVSIGWEWLAGLLVAAATAIGGAVMQIIKDQRGRIRELQARDDSRTDDIMQNQIDGNRTLDGLTAAIDKSTAEREKTNTNVAHIGHKVDAMHDDIREVLRHVRDAK